MVPIYRLFTYTSLFTGLIFIDQFSKYIIRTRGGFYICNQNLAFSLSPLLFFLASLSLFVILLVYNFKFKIINLKSISNFLPRLVETTTRRREAGKFKISNFTALESFSSLLILSGAVSNLIDRLYFGCVIDFIDLPFWPTSIATRSIAGWPVFNPADIYITIGAVMLLSSFIKKDSSE